MVSRLLSKITLSYNEIKLIVLKSNLFKNFDPYVWRWPGKSLAVVPLAKGIEIFLGKKAKTSWYELFFYWGHNSEQYAPYSYLEYFRERKNIRNCISLHARTWAKENKIPSNIIGIGQR